MKYAGPRLKRPRPLRKGHTWNLQHRWIVTMPTGGLCSFTAAPTRRDAISRLLTTCAMANETWRGFYRIGFRARRVMITARLLP